MSVIAKLASSLGRNDEVPNQELALEFCQTRNEEGIKIGTMPLPGKYRN